MEKDLKDLLLQDLCGRLPHSVKILVPSWDEREMKYSIYKVDILYSINGDEYIKSVYEDCDFSLEDIKPYLFPLSSMTEEQRREFDQIIELELKAINNEIDRTQVKMFEVDFYNRHHLDWRGLIPKCLAIDATGLNIY